MPTARREGENSSSSCAFVGEWCLKNILGIPRINIRGIPSINIRSALPAVPVVSPVRQ